MRRRAVARTFGRRAAPRTAARLVVAALIGAALTGPAPLWPQSAVASRPGDAVAQARRAPSSAPRRPFEHRRHERVSCRECHGTGARHRTILVRTSTDCASCHHDARLAKGCSACHEPTRLPTGTRVAVEMALSVRHRAGTRNLPFGHDRHEKVACRDCHGTPVTLARNRDCGSCHDKHHRAESICSSCHERATDDRTLRAAHGDAAHLSCAGAECHAPRVAPSPVLSRSLCLVCHAAQRAHEPDGSCASCHKIPGAPAPARGVLSALRGPERQP
jgi:hypothetical protein